MFDPDKVERPFVKEWGHHAVYVQDYDQLLELYRALQGLADTIPNLPQHLWSSKRYASVRARQQDQIDHPGSVEGAMAGNHFNR